MAMKDLNKFARTWVKALIHGKDGKKYKRTKGTLTSHGRYCCLGVACDLQKEVPRMEWSQESSLYSLAEPIREKLNLRTDSGAFEKGAFKRYPDCDNLADLNDYHKVTFEEIGKFIATNPPGLFNPKTVNTSVAGD